MLLATDKEEYGTYWGAGGAATAYAGVIKGPIRITWAQGVHVTVPQIKVIHSAEPLVLWGSDIMARRGSWAFENLGYNA